MKLSRQALFASLAAACLAAASAPARAQVQPRGRVERIAPRATAAPKATAPSYSVEVPLVQRYSPAGGGQSGTLVLNSAHSFNVTLTATNQHNGNAIGQGVALPQTDTFGYFSLPSLTNNPSNPEVFVKILDGRPLNGNYWVFYGHLTDLIYDLTVTENATGHSKTYHKDAGNAPGGFDTSGFPSSPVVTTSTKATADTTFTPDSFVRTSIDITNNTTTDGVNALVQYCYTLAGSFQGCTNQRSIPLGHFDNFHQDDIVQYLGTLGDLAPGAESNSYGTLFVTFQNLPSQQGWEGTVTARTYNKVSEVDPQRGTLGCGEVVSLFFESATASLVGTARDTVPAPGLEGSLVTNLGIHNTDIYGSPVPATVTVDVTLYDPTTGLPVGNQITLSNIAVGEVRMVNDLFSAAAVPAAIQSVIVFADTRNTTANSPTIEGFLLVQDTNSGDSRFHEMKCEAGCPGP